MASDADVLLVADDLTGAMDTAHGFASRGLETVVHVVETNRATPIESSVVAVNTDTRYADGATARRTVERAVSAYGADASDPPIVYEKVDSTLRGNVRVELEATLEATGADLAIVAPAFPAAGRTTRNGVHLVDGTPLDETAYADDEAGAESSHLPTLCSAPRHPTYHVPLDDVAAGPDALGETVREIVAERPDADGLILTFDATRASHLESIAEAAAGLDERVVYVGSGGLARYVRVSEGTSEPGGAVERDANARDAEDRNRNRAPGGVLGIVGSVNERTLAQLAAVPSESIVELEPSTVVTAPEEAGRRGGTRAAQLLTGDERTRPGTRTEAGTRRRTQAVVTAARTTEALEEAHAVGRDRGYEPAEVRARAKRALAEAARTAVDAHRPAGVFVTGGDVAVAVFEILGATAIELAGEEVADGVPLGRIATGPLAGTSVVTKAGGFGDESVIVNSLSRLENCEQR